MSASMHTFQRGSPYLQVGSQMRWVVAFPGQCTKWKTHNVRTPPRSDSGEATPQNHPQETVLLQTARGLLFKSALGPTVIHHAGVEDRGAPSSWVRGYLKKKNHNSRRREGRCWKIPKIPVKSHKEVQSHKSHKEYLVIVRVISQDTF